MDFEDKINAKKRTQKLQNENQEKEASDYKNNI